MDAIRAKSIRQTSRLIDLADARGYTVRAPRDAARRGGTVAVDVQHAYEVSRYLLERNVLVDFRTGAGIRIAPHFYTTDEELEYATAVIDEAIASSGCEFERARRRRMCRVESAARAHFSELGFLGGGGALE